MIKLSTIIVISLCFATSVMGMEDFNNPFISDANTRALWHFDESSGDTIAVDAGSYGHDGKLEANINS